LRCALEYWTCLFGSPLVRLIVYLLFSCMYRALAALCSRPHSRLTAHIFAFHRGSVITLVCINSAVPYRHCSLSASLQPCSGLPLRCSCVNRVSSLHGVPHHYCRSSSATSVLISRTHIAPVRLAGSVEPAVPVCHVGFVSLVSLGLLSRSATSDLYHLCHLGFCHGLPRRICITCVTWACFELPRRLVLQFSLGLPRRSSL
jgi:hypothetical protein